MTVSNTTMYVLMAIMVNYLIVYKKNKVIGDIIFVAIGLGMWSVEVTQDWIGMTIFFGALISLIYDLITSMGKKTMGKKR